MSTENQVRDDEEQRPQARRSPPPEESDTPSTNSIAAMASDVADALDWFVVHVRADKKTTGHQALAAEAEELARNVRKYAAIVAPPPKTGAGQGGMISSTRDGPTVDDIARLAHEVNRAYCAALGDISQVPWEEAPEWQKESARKGVQLHLCNPGLPPSASHQSWLDEKERTGWKYGPEKNPVKKEHPCFVPFEQLPREQQVQVKDHLFKAVVNALRPEDPPAVLARRPDPRYPLP